MSTAFDKERYDAYVAQGFSPIAAAVACGAETSEGETFVDETGTEVHVLLVEMPE
jgi:hypothetical protein